MRLFLVQQSGIGFGVWSWPDNFSKHDNAALRQILETLALSFGSSVRHKIETNTKPTTIRNESGNGKGKEKGRQIAFLTTRHWRKLSSAAKSHAVPLPTLRRTSRCSVDPAIQRSSHSRHSVTLASQQGQVAPFVTCLLVVLFCHFLAFNSLFDRRIPHHPPSIVTGLAATVVCSKGMPSMQLGGATQRSAGIRLVK
ncbi:hypothetical protein BD289DRAFT_9526 [Coniella lustricola]|uniref:Uncharacterized protein n=1 Tax=Coniella lustricola TaxID=2025994 RepID=A0A2T3A4G5_9PEZI|nr:hypothetical protein BD289DRAFT_9526 [Coniella lustricola]